MDQVVFEIVYILSCFFDTYILSLYMKLFLGKPIVSKKILLSVYLISTIASITQFFYAPLPMLNMIDQIVFSILISLCYTRKLWPCVISVLIPNFCGLIGETFLALGVGISGVSAVTKIVYLNTMQTILKEIIAVVIYRLVTLFKNIGKSTVLPKKIQITSIFLCMAASVLAIESERQTGIDYVFRLMYGITMFIILFIILYFYNMLSESYEEKLRTEVIKRENRYYYKQAELLQSSNKNIREIKHDMKNHLYVLQSMLGEEEGEAKAYIEKLMGKIQAVTVYSSTGILALDSIINYKLSLAADSEIEVQTKLKIPEKLDVDEEDLVTIFGNILDNAIEATQRLDAGKHIRLMVKYQAGTILITCINSYDGIINKKDGQLKSRKEDPTLHGFGLQSIENVVEKYHGVIEKTYDEKEFRIQIFMYLT